MGLVKKGWAESYDLSRNHPAARPPEVEGSIVLALLATESLHGECEVQLTAPHFLDKGRRACIVDATSSVGGDFNRLLLGFLRREFGPLAFRVHILDGSQQSVATAA
jgi:hypothetical protein